MSRPGLNAYQRWNGTGSNIAGTPQERDVNRDENRFNQYGGGLGGPIWKNRIFAFFNWETSPLSAEATSQGWYETSQFDSSAAATGSIAAQYLSFPGEAAANNGIIQRSCASIGLQEGVNCITTSGGLDVGSPIKTGLGMQDLTYAGNTSGDGTKFFLAPSYVQGPTFPATAPAPVPGILRNSLNGPGYNDVDASLTKAFGLPRIPVLGENAKFEIRADSYNLFNKTNLNTAHMDTNLGSAAPDGTVSPSSDFGVVGEALGSRTVQIQARFSF